MAQYYPEQSGVWDTGWGSEAYNAKPYDEYQKKVSGYAGDVMGNVTAMMPKFTGKTGSTDWNSTWGAAYPDIRNPEARSAVGAFSNEMMGEQGNAVNEFVNRAGNLGARGGMGTAGGPNNRSALMQEAIKNLSGGATDRFKQAMQYVKEMYGTQYGAQQDAFNTMAGLAPQLLGLEKGAIDSGTGYSTNMFGMRREDYNADRKAEADWQQQQLEYLRGEPERSAARTAESEKKQKQMELDQMLKSVTMGQNSRAPMSDANRGYWSYLQSRGQMPIMSDTKMQVMPQSAF